MRMKFKKIIIFIVTVLILTGIILPIEAQPFFTEEEKEYIAKSPVLKGVTIDGVAPLHYKDSKGEIKGISIRIFDEISDMTGLKFKYELYDSVESSLKKDYDFYLSAVSGYAPEYMIFSRPYLKSETILFMNSSVDVNQLEDKIYAGVEGGALPEGVKEEKAIYFGNREDTLNAVEKGKADYGYGNAYSVAYYTIMYDYKNIVTVPIKKESREYCIGLPEKDEILLSILNKAIDNIDESHMQTLILDVTSRIERKLTFPMIIENYGKEFFAIVLLVMVLLLFSVIINAKINKMLRMQNKRYETLAHISNEYLYDYHVASDKLELSERSVQLFGNEKALKYAKDILKNSILSIALDASTKLADNDGSFEGNISIIKLPLANGKLGVFRTINTVINDDNGKIYSILGKLIDISEETEEKEKLIKKASIDGLTGLYNATTAKELITDSIKHKSKDSIDALIIMDCDNFKYINDTFGHLKGNEVLENISKVMKFVFRQTDIMGRIGGDEFCVYIKNIPSEDFIQQKYHRFSSLMGDTIKEFRVTISMGVVLVKDKCPFDELFKKADEALYTAKGKGGGQFVLYCKE